ncbi:MAG: hypothetical protein DBX40_07590 [Clostridiales bacterium]|nr:MAG: hypothetical protein DBX40_07590 [Clostridiales bacterium]
MASITDYARMCKAHDDKCGVAYCPISHNHNGFKCSCTYLLRHHPAEASAIIDKWCAEHQQKTYRQDFLEKFPNAAMYGNGCLIDCRNNVYGWKGRACIENCIVCWYEVMQEETGNE